MDSYDVQHSENGNKNRKDETENLSESTGSNTVTSELTLVLIGNKNSIEIGSKNILLDHDQEIYEKELSSRLYDLFGRQISLINMLGFPSIDRIPEISEDHAFILLISNGLHDSQYTFGMQWLEKTLGKEHKSYIMTVVTHDADEICESALQDLKAKSNFSEKRYHICTRSMMDGNEIAALLKKIDGMVSENSRMTEGKGTHQYETLRKAEDSESDDEFQDAFEYLEEDHRCKSSQPEVNLGKCQPTDKGTNDVNVSEKQYEQKENAVEQKRKKHSKEIETLLRRLNLQDKCQQKLVLTDFLKIALPLKHCDFTSEKELARVFLQKLMTLDYRARYIPVQQVSSKMRNSRSVQSSTEENEMYNLMKINANSDEQSAQFHIHPMDVQMAIFHCSDSFLKQKMITKLSECHYALPLLVPDINTEKIECPLWTFRQITKTWKLTETKQNSTTVIMKSMPIYEAETPMVTFFRLGSMSFSKSQLMNALINDRHDTFFHRNCRGSTKSRYLMEGVAEIAWYCPVGKPNDLFTDCIAFCNLHGDSLTILKQREILTELSSVIVVLIPTLDNKDKNWAVIFELLRSSKPLICLIADNCDDRNLNFGKYKLGLKGKNYADISDTLKEIIQILLPGSNTFFKLDMMDKVSDIRVDEGGKFCQEGKDASMEIVKLFTGMDASKIKDTFLPCQGQLWHEWCRINKEILHLKGHIEMEKAQKDQQLLALRQQQLNYPLSRVIDLFTQSLENLKSEKKEYFIKWTQILLDALSTNGVSSVLQNYNETWSEVSELKRKHDKSAQLKGKQAELEQLSKKLQSATFGLEHFFREMGQIYEAHKSLKKRSLGQQTEWTKYPELAADLMISGYPMELMDGDAGHVPLIWIYSLLQKVINKLGDPKVFVLSVLGVQSSGKSTMLNAMFGLQFAVSAGRCTKGAYMQLVKMSEEIKDNYKFDYILVVDTEGLRPPELAGNATLHHDNELATFFVGLGNMTLINIFGENPAEMPDVLQIVVQAFMRMKKVKLSPSCVFVHQNVTDIAAAEKNMDGKRCLQEKLDKMAQLAAKEEVCDVQCFSDVISFDVQEDVKYFPQLWEGSPPMAPPNPGYSESVHELKSILLSKASQSTGITLSHFNAKIQDLWNALMNEHFVFSFKNTHEIAVYRKLEVQYGNWTWTLRSEMLNIENQLYPRIEKGQLDKVELSYLNEEMCRTYKEVKTSMTAHFNDEKEKEILVQWQGRFETKIKEFHEELTKDVKKKLDEVIQQNNARKMLDSKKTEFENKLFLESKKVSHKLRCNAAGEEELKAEFNSVWSRWVKELTSETKPIEDINLENDRCTVLKDLGVEPGLINESRKNNTYKNLSEAGNYSHYVTVKKNFVVLGKALKIGDLPYKEQELIRSFIIYLEKECVEAIKTKPVATRGYRSTYLQELAKNVKQRVTEFESDKTFTFKKEFTVDLSLYVFDRAEGWLQNSHHNYKENNDALTYLHSKKTEYYNIFSSYCKGSSSAVVFGEMMCEKLKGSAIEAVFNKTGVDIAGEIMCSFPAFSGNRLNLEKHVLASLAEKEDFNSFITYIRNPRDQVEAFIREEVNQYMFTTQEGKAQAILKKNVEDITRIISQALFEATEEVKKRNGDIEMWVEQFSSKLKPKLTLGTISCQNFRDINNFDFLKEETEKVLKNITTEMSKLSLRKVNDCRQKPEQILIDQLCNCCWERCPFCAAVCTNTLKDHSPEKHSVPFHRPNGVQGWHRKGKDDLLIDFCTTLVASESSFDPEQDSEQIIPYKQYPTAGGKYASWSITADASMLAYWKWFVCHFQKKLEDCYNRKFQGDGEIPQQWKKLSKEDAIESLNEMCNL